MSKRFEGKVAIVTGSSKGIGNAIATRLAIDGASVVLNARSRGDLERATAELASHGASVRSVVADLTDDDAGERLVAEAVAEFGRIDLIVSSIGLAPYIGPVAGADRDSFARTMVGNTWLCMSLVQAALKAGLGDRRQHRQHLGDRHPQALRAGRDLLGQQGCARRVDRVAGAGARTARHPRERRRAGVDADSDDAVHAR